MITYAYMCVTPIGFPGGRTTQTVTWMSTSISLALQILLFGGLANTKIIQNPHSKQIRGTLIRHKAGSRENCAETIAVVSGICVSLISDTSVA